MATETYKYFTAEQSNLRSEYGSASIINYGGTGGADGSSAEVSAETLTLRYLSTKIDRPLNGTDFLVDFYTLTGFPTYLRVSDTFYSLISPYFTTSETNSVVSSLPTINGTYTYTASRLMQYQPSSRRKTVICIGDSITDGNGTDNGTVNGQLTADKLLVYPTVAINSISGETLSVINNTGKREMVSNNYKLINIALGGTNYDNSVAGGEEQNLYPLRFSLAYNQRVKTLPLNDCIDNIVMSIWLGTNDLNYDSSQTGADVWQRAVDRIGIIRTDFPNIKIILGTTIKRSESTTFNNKVDAYNTLIRDNYASIGVSAIADFENEIPQLNTSAGDTTNTTYYTDGVHVTNLSHTLLASVWKTALLSVI
jgi:lysophospholipase L1-like esterase